jgi:hypothetical protein
MKEEIKNFMEKLVKEKKLQNDLLTKMIERNTQEEEKTSLDSTKKFFDEKSEEIQQYFYKIVEQCPAVKIYLASLFGLAGLGFSIKQIYEITLICKQCKKEACTLEKNKNCKKKKPKYSKMPTNSEQSVSPSKLKIVTM